MRDGVAVMLRSMPRFRGKWYVAQAVHSVFHPDSVKSSRRWVELSAGYRMQLDLRSSTEYQAYYTGEYDNQAMTIAFRLLQDGASVLDVGANIGFWTVPLANRVGAEGHVHAFEPSRSNIDHLEINLGANNLLERVHLHNVGLSDVADTLQLSLRGDFEAGSATGNASIVIDEIDRQFSCVEISVVPLDDVFPGIGLPRVDFIKLDIEGHEDRFLIGAERTIAAYRPVIYLELNEPYYERRGIDLTVFCNKWLAAHSYEAAFISRAGQVSIRPIESRRQSLDNAFFLPRERSGQLLRVMNDLPG
jgi:FkbM family methyltransferase